MKPINDTIKKMREELGLSQGQLAERSDLSVAYISKLEGGKYASLTIKTCKLLANGFGMNIREFLEEVGIILHNQEKPSFKMVGQALRGSGYNQKEIDDVMEYAKYLKSRRVDK